MRPREAVLLFVDRTQPTPGEGANYVGRDEIGAETRIPRIGAEMIIVASVSRNRYLVDKADRLDHANIGRDGGLQETEHRSQIVEPQRTGEPVM